MTHLLLWGNAYSQIIRNGKGEVVALYPLMPDRMKVNRDEHGRLYYEYTVYDSDDVDGRKGTNKVGRTVRLQPHDVLHIPGLGFDGLVGYSPIAMAKNAIGLAKKLRAIDREMTTPLLLLRCVQLGIHISELDLLTIGTVLDMYTELQRDDEPHDQLASQEDFDRF